MYLNCLYPPSLPPTGVCWFKPPAQARTNTVQHAQHSQHDQHPTNVTPPQTDGTHGQIQTDRQTDGHPERQAMAPTAVERERSPRIIVHTGGWSDRKAAVRAEDWV